MFYRRRTDVRGTLVVPATALLYSSVQPAWQLAGWALGVWYMKFHQHLVKRFFYRQEHRAQRGGVTW